MLEERYQIIQQRIAAACERVGRQPSEITLVAISKTHPPESVNALSALGVRHFGENKVQEARAKIPLCDGRLAWHFVGHLQTNKVRDAVRFFTSIQSVDSIRLAREIEKDAAKESRRPAILLEVNVSDEASKFGLEPGMVAETARGINQLPHLELRGLMTMAPFSEESELSRPYFRQLAELKRSLEQELGAPLPDLSMGMSGDFEVGIEEGATIIRVGTALFGERSHPPPENAGA